MRVRKLPSRFLVITFCLALISLTFSNQALYAQSKPLTLAQVLTGLQSKSGGFTLSQKNTFITKEVQKKGVTFKLSPELERELRSAGASTSLIRAIRLKNPGANTVTPSKKPDAKIAKGWVVQNVTKNGVKGINAYANFTLYNLKGVLTNVKFRFIKNEKFVRTNTQLYKSSKSYLRGLRNLKAAHTAAVYEDIGVFIPYSAFNLSPGVHNVKLDVDIVYRDGKDMKHLDAIPVRLVIPTVKVVRKAGVAKFGRIWVDYGETENGKLGMRVHLKLTVRGMKDENAYVEVKFTKADGTLLYAKSPSYQSKSGNGQTTAYRLITPIYTSANFGDVSVFVPYDEFNLPPGRYNLKIHADLVYADFSPVGHLTYKNFTYSKK